MTEDGSGASLDGAVLILSMQFISFVRSAKALGREGRPIRPTGAIRSRSSDLWSSAYLTL